MERQMRKLDELMDGAVTERFNVERDRVMKNIYDPNTDPEAKRQITITITIEPNESRDVGRYKVEVKSKIAPMAPITQVCFLRQSDDGMVVATEVTKQVPGQMDMDGNEAPMPRVVEFGKSNKEKAN